MNRLLEEAISIYRYDPVKTRITAYTSRYIVINLILFLIPLLFDLPQILQGTIINLILIYIALNFKRMELIPSILLPSLSAGLRGTLIGTITPYLVIIMPVIWLGNLIFIVSIRYLSMRKWNILPVLLSSGILKSLTLFLFTLILVKSFDLPSILLSSMGVLQLATASLAGLVYISLFKLKHDKENT